MSNAGTFLFCSFAYLQRLSDSGNYDINIVILTQIDIFCAFFRATQKQNWMCIYVFHTILY